MDSIFKDLRYPYRAKLALIDFCLQAQNEYWRFEARRMNRDAPLEGADRLCQQFSFNVSGHSIVFHCYNTAWLSQRREKPGQLIMPLDIVPEPPECDLLVSLLHHPFNWLQPDNAKAFRKLIERDSDLVMTGHEHESDGAVKHTFNGAILRVSEGSVLQEHGSWRSGFVAHVIDFQKKEFRVAEYERVADPRRYRIKQQSDWGPIERNPLRRSAHLNNTPEFLGHLIDIGVKFTHPVKDTLELDDLFVYPEFERRTPVIDPSSGGKLSSQVITSLSSEDVVSFLQETKEALFFGPDRCGKTTFAKKIYRELQETHSIPLLLKGSNLTVDDRDFDKAVLGAVTAQYGAEQIEKFKDLHKADKTLIVDDFHLAAADMGSRNRGELLNIKGQNALLELMRQRFGKIVIVASDILRFEEFTQQADEVSHLLTLDHCEFRQFGNHLRYKLIDKWY